MATTWGSQLGERPRPWCELAGEIAALPPGQRRVVVALFEPSGPPTYRAVAAALGLHVGSVYEHLRRVRRARPALYEALMAGRRAGQAEVHRAAVARAQARTHRWYTLAAARRGWPPPEAEYPAWRVMHWR